MIKMFGVRGEKDAQPGGCNLNGSRSGLHPQRVEERKTCRSVYSGTWTSGQVLSLPPSHCMFSLQTKASVP